MGEKSLQLFYIFGGGEDKEMIRTKFLLDL